MTTTNKKQRQQFEQALQQADCAKAALELGADFLSRRIYLMGEVNPETAYRFIVPFHTMDSYEGPIVVVLNSPGGSVSDGLAIYDAIKMANNEVTVLALGCAQSMGALIMQAAETRLVTPECRFMIHNGSCVVGQVAADTFIALGKETQRGNRDYQRILANRSGLPLKKVAALCAKETYFSASETVLANFADGILQPDGTALTAKDLKVP